MTGEGAKRVSVAERSMPCPNCGQAGDGRFCQECGQAHGDLFPNVVSVVKEALDEFAGINGKLPQSIKRLVWPPGELTREWIQGRRARFVSPIRLYLALAVLFFFAWPYTGFAEGLEGFVQGFLGAPSASGAEPSETARVGEAIVLRGLPGILILVLVPFFAMALYLLNRLEGAFVSHFVAALHLHAMFFLVVAATAPLGILPNALWTKTVEPVLLVLLFAFLCVSLARVYELSAWRALARAFVLISIYSLATTAMIGLVLVLFVELSGRAV